MFKRGKTKPQSFNRRFVCVCSAAAVCFLLSSCSLWKDSDVAVAKELPSNPGLIGVKQAWSVEVASSLRSSPSVDARNNILTFVASGGRITSLNAATGQISTQFDTNESAVTGVGSDGQTAAYVTDSNEVVAVRASQVVWRHKLSAQSFTPPLVAGKRVFVLSADHSVYAFDAENGYRLWVRQRQGDALVVKQKGVLFAAGNTLVTGFAGRLVGLSPDTGGILWEATIASSRGANDIDRLVQMSGQVSRVGQSVCALAFQSAIGCINLDTARTVWTENFEGAEGVAGDEDAIFSATRKGVVSAWRRAEGAKLWSSDVLQFRKLTAPLLLGRSIVFGDDGGNVYFLSKEDGSIIERTFTNASGVVDAPVVVGNTLVVTTKNGTVYGFRPQ